jgi:hypothetical protein
LFMKALSKLVCMVLLVTSVSISWQPSGVTAAPSQTIGFNPIPSQVHRITDRYQVTVNGTTLPVVDGLYTTTITENGETRTIKPDYLGYDYANFTASPGDTEIVIRAKSKINSINVSPLKLSIVPVKVDDYTYKFTIGSQQYLIVEINGKELVITRDDPEEYVPTLGTAGVFNVADRLGSTNAAQQNNVAAITAAFQQTVNDAHTYGTAAGGGKKGIVYVPAGLYYMGNLTLKSNVALYLAPGSVIRMTDDYSHYRVDFNKASLGRDGTWWIATENNSTNIKVFGRGTLDGNGHYFQKDKPKTDRGYAATLLMIMGTDNFTLDGPVIKNAPFWGTIVARSNNVNIKNMKFFNSLDGNENDCLDINESQNVKVWNAIAISLDDTYSTKTWAGTGMSQNWYGQPQILDNVTFNNVFGWTYCATFKIGHGTFQPQSNVTFKNGVTYSAGRAIGVEHVYGTAPVSNITFENIDIENATGEGWFKAVIEDGGQGVGTISNILVKDINVRHRGSASSLKGYNSATKIKGVTFDKIRTLGNPDPVTSLSELNITKRGYYEDVTLLPDRRFEAVHRIEAESNNGLFGVDWNGTPIIKHAISNDSGGVGYQVSNIAHSNYVLFKDVDFGTSTSKVRIRFDAPRSSLVELYVDNGQGGMGALIGSLTIPGNNNQWLNWNFYDIPVSTSSIHDLYVVFKAAGSSQTNQLLGSLNWLETYRSF